MERKRRVPPRETVRKDTSLRTPELDPRCRQSTQQSLAMDYLAAGEIDLDWSGFAAGFWLSMGTSRIAPIYRCSELCVSPRALAGRAPQRT